MSQFLATFFKDLLIIWRDRAGMLVLFAMPMALVLVVSLVQNNVLEATGQTALSVFLVDQDHGFVGEQLRQRLDLSSGIKLVTQFDSEPLHEESARLLVAKGDYQFGILIPPGTSDQLRADVARQVLQLFSDGTEIETATEGQQIEVFFDPAVQGVFRTAVLGTLRHALLGLEVVQQRRELSRAVSDQFGTVAASVDFKPDPSGSRGLLVIAEEVAGVAKQTSRPNAVQQNVPAWSLFGMFFIVVPLSGALLRELQEGTLRRLLTLPAPYWALLSGKTLAYVAVCMLQFCLMLLVGKFILPLFGTPEFVLGDQPVAVFLLAFCAALAATGYGLLVGTLSRSYDQASMFGAVSVVIAAALGGVMVPVYVMPKGMQLISSFSPLAWGLDGFLEIFVRNGTLQNITNNLLALFGFFLVTTIASLLVFSRKGQSGG